MPEQKSVMEIIRDKIQSNLESVPIEYQSITIRDHTITIKFPKDGNKELLESEHTTGMSGLSELFTGDAE